MLMICKKCCLLTVIGINNYMPFYIYVTYILSQVLAAVRASEAAVLESPGSWQDVEDVLCEIM